MEEIIFDVSPELKIECLRIAAKGKYDSGESLLADAKFFYIWVSEVPEQPIPKDNVFSLVEKDKDD